jgi:peptidylprolyl isomerase
LGKKRGNHVANAKKGNRIKIHYQVKLNDGTVFDDSKEHGALEFKIGEGRVIKGLEEAVVGMAQGEKKTVTIEPEKGYGERREELVKVISKEQVPPNLELKPGQQIEVRQTKGESFPVTVVEITESDVTLDANHPLAGEELTLDIELVEIL